MGKIKNEITRAFKAVFEEAVDHSFQDIHRNVDNFYNSPQGQYERTGQLAESPQINSCTISDTAAHAQLSLDTSYTYVPSGRDTNTIYGYAESGGLLGNGGFWEKSMEDIEKNLKDAFESRFK
ncbi:MAG: hypothetical protein Q4C77_07610 [Eubacteriales bacterium]|nr:hypothetical protein [Eubacteriales bacterium]